MGDQRDTARPGNAPKEGPGKHQRELFGEPASRRTGGDPSDPGESGSGRGPSIPPGRDEVRADNPPNESPG